MAAARHNLSRRALLGAGVGAPFVHGLHIVHPMHAAPPAACPEPAASEVEGRSRRAWSLTLAAYRSAEARVASFKAAERALPPERREWPAVRELEEKFGDLDGLRLAALRRLLRLPSPDLAALSLKLDLAVADQAWELTGCESCLAAIANDARRLCRA